MSFVHFGQLSVLLFLLNRFVAERFNDDSVDDECPKLLVVLRIVDSLMAMKFDDV